MSNFDSEHASKIDVTSELLKMGIKIVVPQVAPKTSLKSLGDADFVAKNNNTDEKKPTLGKKEEEILSWREDAKKEGRRRRKKAASVSVTTATTKHSSSPCATQTSMLHLAESLDEHEFGLSTTEVFYAEAQSQEAIFTDKPVPKLYAQQKNNSNQQQLRDAQNSLPHTQNQHQHHQRQHQQQNMRQQQQQKNGSNQQNTNSKIKVLIYQKDFLSFLLYRF